MENTAHAIAAGLFLLLLGLALAASVAWFQGDRTERVHYTVVARSGVPGLHPTAPVKLRGVEVRYVDDGRDGGGRGRDGLRRDVGRAHVVGDDGDIGDVRCRGELVRLDAGLAGCCSVGPGARRGAVTETWLVGAQVGLSHRSLAAGAC